MVKKTIAVLGNTGKFSPGLIEVLMKQDLRLLFVSEENTKHIEIKEQLAPVNAAAEIEFISCERDGCWEADIIAISMRDGISPDLVQKIKEVATQKTVLLISEDNRRTVKPELEKLLPYSKVVEMQIDTREKEFAISGIDVEAKTDIRIIFENAGYKLKN